MTTTDTVEREAAGSSRLALGEIARGFIRGKLLCAAVRLGVADALGQGPKTLAELAAETKTNERALRRFLRGLECLGVVEASGTSRFALTKFGEPLRRDAPGSVWASMIFWADLLDDAWTYLPDCIRAGDRTGAEAARKRDGSTSRWAMEKDAKAIFHSVFAEPAAEDFGPFVGAMDLSKCNVVADLGGGGGGLLAAILAARPDARGILVEREGAIEGARKRFEGAGLKSRYELVAGDLLESVPAGADTYVMRCVLHGYDDASAARILGNVRRAMGPESRLLLIEVVLPDRFGKADEELEKLVMSDLNMLAVTGGCERSESEWRALLESAGFAVRKVAAVAGQPLSFIEAAGSR